MLEMSNMPVPVQSAGYLLKAVHGDAQGFVCIWTSKDKASKFFANSDSGRAQAAGYAIQRATDSDVYFGLGLFDKPLAQGRGKAADVIGIGCVWADVDFGPGHKKPVAPDEATARRIISSVIPAPSIIVHSGGGLHCYWLLRTFWRFGDDDDRQVAAALVERWQATIRLALEAEGYTLDSTHDLARVLRLPGTSHRKNPAHIRPVRIISPGGELNGDVVRYAVADFAVASRPDDQTISADDGNINRSEHEANVPPIAPTTGLSALDRCLRYLANCPDAISGNGGHDATSTPHASVSGLASATAMPAGQWTRSTKRRPETRSGPPQKLNTS